jgi:hypothetical protein
VAPNVGIKIRQLVIRVGKWVTTCVVLDAKVRRVLVRVVEPNESFELERGGFRREIDKRDAVAEGVLDPSRLSWRW